MSFRFAFRKIIFSSFLPLSFFIFSCASAPKNSKAKEVHDVYDPDDFGVAIDVGEIEIKRNKNYKFFSKIDEEVMSLVEYGSPDSIRRAFGELKKDETSDLPVEQEKVLCFILKSIMEMVWPSEVFDIENITDITQNAYTGAINSAKNQIYDLSTGNGDFLAVILPSLVIVQTSDVSSFYTDSKNALGLALQKNPDSVLANYLLGMLYFKNGEKKNALSFFKKAWGNSSENLETNYAYIKCLYDERKYKDAKGILNSAMLRFSQNISIMKLKAKVDFALGDYNGAEDSINRVLQKDPNDLEAFLFRAKILIEKEDYIHAASLLDVYARHDNSSKEYLLLRARIQLEWSRNVPAVIETVSKALINYPQDKDVILFAAKVCNTTKNKINGKSCSQFAQDVLEKDPEDTEAIRYAIEGFASEKKWETAYSYSSEYLKKNDDSLQMIFNHIEICLALGKIDEAWNVVLPLYKKNPKDEQVLQSYISVLSKTSRSAEAVSLINELLSSSSSKMKSYLYYMRSILQTKESDRLSDLRSSIIANPRNSDSLFSLYEVYFKKQDYRKAQYYLKQVVALCPNDAYVLKLNEELSDLMK